MKAAIKYTLAATAVAVLAACGGGSNNTPATASSPAIASWVNTKQLGVAGAKNTTGRAVATDSSGNVYIVGETDGNLDNNTRTGSLDAFITKYSGSGNREWTKLLGVAGWTTSASGVATDSSGNVYVVGKTNGSLFEGTLEGSQDMFVAKYTSGGTRLWTRLLGVAGSETVAAGVATDASGNVFVGGTTDGGLAGKTLTGFKDFFVTKYDASGDRKWTELLGVADSVTVAAGVATDTSGNVFVGGTTDGGLAGKTLSGFKDFFITKYDGSGDRKWTELLGSASSLIEAKGVATDPSGHVFITGFTDGGLDGNALSGTQDFFVTKYDGNGAKQFTRQVGVAGANAQGYAVATDSSGNVYVAGQTTGGLDGNSLTGPEDQFLAKFNGSGVKQYIRQSPLRAALAKTRETTTLTTDSSGNVFVAGTTSRGLDGNSLAGNQDFFITKYNSSGVKQ